MYSTASDPPRPHIKRRKPPLDPAEVEEMVAALRDAVVAIQKERAAPDIMDLYEKAHTLLLHREAEQMYTLFREGMQDHLQEVRSHVQSAGYSDMFRALLSAWQDHLTAVEKMKNILIYNEPVYVQSGQAVDVRGLGLLLFRDVVLNETSLGAALRDCMLDIVARERNGERSEREMLKNLCQMLQELSLENCEVYRVDFERHLLKDSRAFYRAESRRLLHTSSATEYLKRVERRIEEEARLAELQLHPSTKKKLIQIVDDELIKYHLEEIVKMEKSGLVYLIDNQQMEDLSRMYKLYSRVEGGLLLLMKSVSAFLRERGRAIIFEDEKGSKGSAVHIVQSLIDLHDQFYRLLAEPLNQDEDFVERVHQDFEVFLNLSERSAEHLSLFVDDLFRRGAKRWTEQDLETVLDKCIVLFRYLHEKDKFKDYYERHLGKRLLDSKNYSDDQEKTMLSKLKTERGSEYTRTMEGMLKDIALSVTTMENYRRWSEEGGVARGEVELTVRVLTTSTWLQRAVSTVLPVVAQTTFQTFQTFYKYEHSGRRLTLLPHLGNADLNFNFKADKQYILQVTTHQMCVLTMFNRKPAFTLKELEEETEIPREQLVRVLLSLANYKGKPQFRVLTVKREYSTREGARREESTREGERKEESTRGEEGKEESTREGEREEESTREGATMKESTREGATKEESTREGAMKEESTREGATMKESIREGATKEESTREGATKEESVREGARKEPPREHRGNIFSSGDMFSVNEQYSSKLFRVKIPHLISRVETEEERRVTNKRVDQKRRLLIQATLVRVMKARKRLHHQILVAECLSQLRVRFPAHPPAVKEEIQSLIEREYLRRAADDTAVYEYLAGDDSNTDQTTHPDYALQTTPPDPNP